MAKATNNGQLKISQLVAFAAVAQHGGFSAAALHLDLAQSTVSHAIASLEEDLGVVLLLRNRSGAVLTPIGSQIYQQAKSVIAQMEAIRHTANQAKDLQTGRVRVAAVRTVATHVLPDVIARFREAYPEMTVEIMECDLYAEAEQALRDGHADLGFTLMPASQEFQSWELFRDEFVALLPPLSAADKSTKNSVVDDGQNEQTEPLTWEALVAYPRVANSRSSRHNRLIDEHVARFGYQLPANPSMRSDVREDSTLMGMVAKGLGVAVLARLEAEPIPPGVRVMSLPEPLERVVGVALLDSAVLPRAVFVFLDVLLAVPVGVPKP